MNVIQYAKYLYDTGNMLRNLSIKFNTDFYNKLLH